MLTWMLLAACTGSKDDDGGGCELDVTVDGGSATLVHGPQGGWHVVVSGRVAGSSGEVSVLPTVRVASTGQALTGEQRPANQSLVGDRFEGVLAFVTALPTLDPRAAICDLDGAPLELEVEIEDLGTGCTAVATTSATAALDPVDVPVCDGTVTTDTGLTDTGTEPPIGADPKLRAIHAATGLPGQDMLGNGNPGNPPLVDLQFGETWPPDGGARRPPRSYTFEFFDHGEVTAWALLDGTMDVDSAYTLIVHGTRDGVGPAAGVLFVEDDLDVPSDAVRVRWTHAATSLPAASLTVRDAVTGATYAGGAILDYGETVVADEALGEIAPWLDLDGDGACDPGEAFEPFERDPGDYFHVLIVEDPAGGLFLLGQTLTGGAPRREQVPCP